MERLAKSTKSVPTSMCTTDETSFCLKQLKVDRNIVKSTYKRSVAKRFEE